MARARVETDTTHYESDVVAGIRDANASGVHLKGGSRPDVTVLGDDTNTSLGLDAKGTGKIVPKKRIMDDITVATLTTAGNQTLTAAQILGGVLLRDPNGGAVTDTLPTAALLVAAVPGAQVGTGFEFAIRNTADAAETITVAAGTGGTASGTMTIAQNNSKRFLVRLDNVTGGSEAYTVYSLGTVVH